MSVFEIFAMIIIIVTMGGCLCDWVFSGMVDPILVEEAARTQMEEDLARYEAYETKKQETKNYTCSSCGMESQYSIDVMQTFGKVRCQNCGQDIFE